MAMHSTKGEEYSVTATRLNARIKSFNQLMYLMDGTTHVRILSQ